ncbi:enzymatic polyprotein [Plakobranchus ocellatus]|uniref:Enzymatic polyprotein n=1 Tax=Plakobranchus ocellatus TaxID=259542 RepID=A0AAV3ZQT7_9GAST|nr:enzymatic polyprotein [Plakobranchus ocellatus]
MVPPNTRKTNFDACNGYHSIALDPKDRHITTFITPWGCCRYCACPQGYIASGDVYIRCFEEVVSNIDKKTKVIDDTIMWSPSIEDSFLQAAKWLDLCGRNNIILNPSKFSFAKEIVNFTGIEFTSTTVRPCPQVLEAIKGFLKPGTITDVKSWFGLINQVSTCFRVSRENATFSRPIETHSSGLITWTTSLKKPKLL